IGSIILETICCQKIFHPPHQLGRRLTLYQNPGLDNVMKPIPPRNAGELTSLPIEHCPDSLTRDLYVPGHKIPVLDARMDSLRTKPGGSSLKMTRSGASLFQFNPGGQF